MEAVTLAIKVLTAPTRCWKGWHDNKIEEEVAKDFMQQVEELIRRAEHGGARGSGEGGADGRTSSENTKALASLKEELDQIRADFEGAVPQEWQHRINNFEELGDNIDKLRDRAQRVLDQLGVTVSLETRDLLREMQVDKGKVARMADDIMRKQSNQGEIAEKAAQRQSVALDEFRDILQNKTSELTQMFEEKNRKEREARNRYERQGRKLNRVTRELEEAQKLLQDKLLLLNKAKRNESAYLLELERLRGEVDGAQQRVNELLKDLEAAKTENKKLEEQWKSALIWQNALRENQGELEALREELRKRSDNSSEQQQQQQQPEVTTAAASSQQQGGARKDRRAPSKADAIDRGDSGAELGGSPSEIVKAVPVIGKSPDDGDRDEETQPLKNEGLQRLVHGGEDVQDRPLACCLEGCATCATHVGQMVASCGGAFSALATGFCNTCGTLGQFGADACSATGRIVFQKSTPVLLICAAGPIAGMARFFIAGETIGFFEVFMFMGPVLAVTIILHIMRQHDVANALASLATLCSAVAGTVVLAMDFCLRGHTIITQKACTTWSLLCFLAALDRKLRPSIREVYEIHENFIPVVRVSCSLLLSLAVVLDLCLQQNTVDIPILLVIVWLAVVTHMLELCNSFDCHKETLGPFFMAMLLVGVTGEIVYTVLWAMESAQTLDKAYHYVFLLVIGGTTLMNIAYEVACDKLRTKKLEVLPLFVAVSGAIASAAGFYVCPCWRSLVYLSVWLVLLLVLEAGSFVCRAVNSEGSFRFDAYVAVLAICLVIATLAIWAPFWVTRIFLASLTCVACLATVQEDSGGLFLVALVVSCAVWFPCRAVFVVIVIIFLALLVLGISMFLFGGFFFFVGMCQQRMDTVVPSLVVSLVSFLVCLFSLWFFDSTMRPVHNVCGFEACWVDRLAEWVWKTIHNKLMGHS